MCISDSHRRKLQSPWPMSCPTNRLMSVRTHLCALAAFSACLLVGGTVSAQATDWELRPVETGTYSAASGWPPDRFSTKCATSPPSTIRFLHASEVVETRRADSRVARVEFDQSLAQEPPSLPAYLRPLEEMPQPPGTEA